MKLDWRHIFNWDIVALNVPETVMDNGRVVGYKVVVTYKYHGTVEEFYSLDEPRLYKVWTGPQDAARASYKEHLRRMRKQLQRQMRTR